MILLAGCAVDPDAFADPPMEAVVVEDPTIDALVRATMADEEIVGLGVGVVEDGELRYLRGYGWQRWPDVPFSAKTTTVRWASLSKSLTATIAAEAAVAGRVDLDADVRKLRPSYVPPDNWDGTTPLTLRRLLGHLGGTRHYGDGAWPWDDGSPPADLTDDPAVNTGMAWALPYWTDDPLVAQPGADFHYSSFGFNLAGVVLEDQLGEPLEVLVQDAIFDPLGMTSAGPDHVWDADPARAAGYTHDVFGGVVPVADHDVSWKLASGGFASTTEDLARWCGAFTTGTFLSDDVRALLWTEQATTTGEETNYGLGFELAGQRVWHSGGNEKASTYFSAWPDDGVCVVLMADTAGVGLGDLAKAIAGG